MSIRLVALLLSLALAAAVEQLSLFRYGNKDKHSEKAPGTNKLPPTNPPPTNPSPAKSPLQNVCPTRNGPQKDSVDMGYRFTKFHMLNGSAATMSWENYPLSDDMAYDLQHYSDGYSVITNKDYEVKQACLENYITAAGGLPAMPSHDPESDYWKQLEIVVRAQKQRRAGKLPPANVLTLPTLWENFTVADIAEAVHGEYPRTHQNNMIKSFLTNGGTGGIELDYNIIPFRSKKDFIGTTVRAAALNTWSLDAVAPTNFAIKWSIGRPRAEEVAWMIATDVITKQDGANPIVVDLVKSMNLKNATSFTAYPEGCPQHPSWPGMHAAGSTSSMWLAVVANLTDEQYCQVLRTDWAVAYGRTVAGVHYEDDNIAGLNVGQQLISEKLPRHLFKMYGADRKAVRRKIRSLRFDWNTFNPEDCTVVYTYGKNQGKSNEQETEN